MDRLRLAPADGISKMSEMRHELFTWISSVLEGESKAHEELALPQPAAALWLKTHGIIEATFSEAGGCRLGGGTLLAARWKHRLSLDIDLTIEPKGKRPQQIEHLIRKGTAFRAGLERLGCGEPTAPSEHQIRVPIDNSVLDICVLDAQPGIGEHRARVNGRLAVVLSTTQVLGGKLARSEKLLHRDAYDIRHAGRIDKESLAKAVNRIDRRETRKIIATWNHISARWAAMAPSQLRSLVPKHSYDPATLAMETGEALRNALYRAVRITTHGREGRFHAETMDGTRLQIAFTRRTLEKTFCENGIDEYLKQHSSALDEDEILKYIKKACRLGAKRQTVYENTHEAPPLETGRPRAAGPPEGGRNTPPPTRPARIDMTGRGKRRDVKGPTR